MSFDQLGSGTNNRLKILGLLNRMGATLFVQPFDLVKSRMQISGWLLRVAVDKRTGTLSRAWVCHNQVKAVL